MGHAALEPQCESEKRCRRAALPPQSKSSAFHSLCSLCVFVACFLLAAVTAGFSQSTIRFTANSCSVPDWATSTAVPDWAGPHRLAVQRTGDINTQVSVDYATADGSATNGWKYAATNGTLVFAPGETKKTIVVQLLDFNEGLVEDAKTFRVILSNPTNAVLGAPTTNTVSIVNVDVGIQFQFSAYSSGTGWPISEDAGAVLLGVVRGDDANIPVTVTIGTSDGTAINGVDYVGFTNTLPFTNTERLKFVSVTILNNTLKQSSRYFRATLSNPVGVSLGATKTTTVTIMDNDQGFQFETNRYDLAEDAGVALIGVLRGTDDTNSTVTVDLTTTDNTATNGLDYVGLTNTLSFAPGERRKVVPIPILNNGTNQGSRNFRVTLSNPTGGAGLSTPTTTTVTIQDNDPGVGFEFGTYTSARGPAGDFPVTVLRGTDSALGPFTMDDATSNGTAQAGMDYEAVTNTLTFQENETVKSISIHILGGDSSKNFRVTLSNPTSGFVLGRATTTVTIGGAYATVTPPFASGLAIRREWGVNVLTWSGGGTLQRADKPTGPWQTLANARSPYTVQSPIATSFYRVTNPRPVNLYVPSSYTGQTNLPLVILLHGYSLSGQDQENYLQFQPLAEARGFLYCYPDGTKDRIGNQFWNATDGGGDLWNTGVDDAGFLRTLIEEIGRRFRVDPKRVFLLGHSNGGRMAYRMACQSADLIAGIGSLAGMPFLDPSRCAPSEPVNILHLHGTGDDIDPYAGGALASPPFTANMPPNPGALKAVQLWAGYNGASNPLTDPAASLDLTTDITGLDTVITRFTTCPPGGAVELWSIIGGSHVPNLSTEFSPRVIDWLLAHPKP